MKTIFIGIVGGSGSGKSTLGYALKNKYPNQIELIHLDDYFKPLADRPKVGDLINSDHPESLSFDKLAEDLVKLSNGETIVVNTKHEYLNPEYQNTKIKIPVKFYPKPIILIDGFLLLHDEKMRKMLDTSIFLDVEHEKRWARRVHLANQNKEYEEKVIIPMHNQFIEPTKKYADHIIDVSDLSQEEVFEKVDKIINKFIK